MMSLPNLLSVSRLKKKRKKIRELKRRTIMSYDSEILFNEFDLWLRDLIKSLRRKDPWTHHIECKMCGKKADTRYKELCYACYMKKWRRER